MIRKLVFASMVCLGVAILGAHPMSLIGWEGAAGLVFIVAMLVAWIAAAAEAIARLWRG